MYPQNETIEVRSKITVNVSPEKAFETFIGRCHQWWPDDYRLGTSSRAITMSEKLKITVNKLIKL